MADGDGRLGPAMPLRPLLAPTRATDPTPTSRPALGVAVGLLWVGLVTALKLAFPEALGVRTPFLLFFVAVVPAAWVGGLRAGLVLTVAGGSVGYVSLLRDAGGVDARDVLVTAMYLLEGAVLSYLGSRVAADRRRSEAATLEARLALEQLELVVGAVEDGITVQDASGRLVFANSAAARISGFASTHDMLAAPPESLMTRYEMSSADGQPFPFAKLPGRVQLAGGASEPQLIGYRDRETGKAGWSLIRANAIRGDRGQIVCVVNVVQDVTERQEQERALAVSREWFSTALSSIGDAVIATDRAGIITFTNPVAEALTGWPSEEARGRPLGEVFHVIQEHDRQAATSPVDKVIAEGVVVGLANNTVLIRRDGSEIAIDDSAAPIRGGGGELEGVVLVFRDVAVQRREQLRTQFLAQATAELNASLDYGATLAKVAKLAVPVIADWCAIDVLENGERRRIAVAHVDQAKVDFVHQIEARYPPDPNATSGVPEILRSGQPEMMSVIPPELLDALAKDAEHLDIIRALALRSYIGVPLARAGETFGVITLVMAESNRIYDDGDLGVALALADRAAIAVENARLYSEAEHARREAESASRTKDEFLAMLGHELRNPLAPILSALDLLQPGSPLSVDRARSVIERQLKHIVRLVDDLLDVSRITRGRVELDRVPVEVSDVVAKALELASPLVEQRQHRVTTEIEPDLVVLGDPVRLAQVVTNLVANAAKYTEPGGHIEVVCRRDGDWAVLNVRDDGIGIEPDMLGRIFDLFVQAPQSIDRAQGGLGLGLPIVQNLVHLQGGSIQARSEGLGLGSDFTVRLPTAPSTAVRVPAPTPPPVAATVSLDILLVDDNEDALELLGEIIGMLGHRPHVASHPRHALALAARVKPSLALLDIGLPEIDGYELARRIRAIDGLASIRLVALTGYGQASDRAKSAASGFDTHLVKPVSMEQLRAAIAALTEP